MVMVGNSINQPINIETIQFAACTLSSTIQRTNNVKNISSITSSLKNLIIFLIFFTQRQHSKSHRPTMLQDCARVYSTVIVSIQICVACRPIKFYETTMKNGENICLKIYQLLTNYYRPTLIKKCNIVSVSAGKHEAQDVKCTGCATPSTLITMSTHKFCAKKPSEEELSQQFGRFKKNYCTELYLSIYIAQCATSCRSIVAIGLLKSAVCEAVGLYIKFTHSFRGVYIYTYRSLTNCFRHPLLITLSAHRMPCRPNT